MDEQALQLEIQIDTEAPEEVEIALHGRLTTDSLRRLPAEIERLLGMGCRHLILDFAELTYIDSPGVAELIPIYQRVSQRDGSLRIARPRRLIRHILVSAHINDVIPIDEAVSDEDSE